MRTDTYFGAEKLKGDSMKKAARRSIADMEAERAAMVKRRAPMAVIEALDRRIQEAERILKEETPCMKSSDT